MTARIRAICLTAFTACFLVLFGVIVVVLNLVTALWDSAYLTYDVGKRVLEQAWSGRGPR